MADYKPGDRVRVREWDDMVEEFGLDMDGDIHCSCTFTRPMRRFCGREYTVSKVLIGEIVEFEEAGLFFEHRHPDSGIGAYTFSFDMIRPADVVVHEADIDIDIDIDGFNAIIFGGVDA